MKAVKKDWVADVSGKGSKGSERRGDSIDDEGEFLDLCHDRE